MIRNALLVVLAIVAIRGSAVAGVRLFGVNNSSVVGGNDFLATIDKTTGTVTQIGVIPFRCDGLSFGPDGRLFAADNTSHRLVTLDPSTAAVSVIGPYVAVNHIEGLAAHPKTGILYGIDNENSRLVTLDTSTGKATIIGSFGTNSGMAGLEWSIDGSILYAIHFSNGCLYSVDVTNGLATQIGCGDPFEPLALAVDPTDGRLFTAEWQNGAPMTLATVDPTNGSRVVVATMAGGNEIEGLAFEPGAKVTVYCTAKPNSLGCLPAIDAQGIPSGLASSGFSVSATNVRNQKPGVLMYTLDGRQVTPFQGGYLCLASPIRRTVVCDSGGSPYIIKDCSGGWRIDMNAFAAGTIGGQPAAGLHRPGTTVHCQWWGRDPLDPFGSALTDALQYQLGE